MPSARVVDLRACVARCSPAELLEAVADPATRAELAAALAGAVEEPPSLAEALDEDVERVAAELAPLLRITAETDAESKEVAAQPSEAVHDAIAAAFGRPVEHIEEALLGADAVPPGDSFDEWGIEVSTVARGPTLTLAATRGGRTGRGSACASWRPRRRWSKSWPT